jgi:GNAT superfamily N-acetyltransferase
VSEPAPIVYDEFALADGTGVRVRAIRANDARELKRGFERLSPASRYRRFLGTMNVLTDAMLHYLTEVDGWNHVAIVATTRPPDTTDEIGVGVARFVRLAGEPAIAEAAITVADDMQGKGIGRHLAITLARLARERGIERFRGEVLADNGVVRELLQDLGAVLRPTEIGRLAFDVPLDAAGPNGPERLIEAIRRLLGAASRELVGAAARALPAPRESDTDQS